MKRLFNKFLSLALVCIFIALAFTSCANEPYPYELEKHISLSPLPEDYTVSETYLLEKVAEKIETVRKNNCIKKNVSDRAATSGDMVNISFVCYPAETYGTDNSRPIQKLSDPDCVLIIGEGKYPQELENAIIGVFLNHKSTVRLTLPEDYSLKEYAGLSLVYEITLNTVTEITLPNYDNEFVKAVSPCSTTEEYEKYLYDRIKEDTVWNEYLKASTVLLYPNEELNEYSSDFLNYYTNLASEKNVSLEEYVAKKYFLELSDFHIKADTYAKEMVKGDLLLYALVNKHGLKLTEDEYNAGAAKYAEEYGFRSVSLLEGKYGSDFVKKSVQKDKVLAYIASGVTVVTP